MEKIEGIPEGWRWVAVREALPGEWYINREGNILQFSPSDGRISSLGCYPIIRKIEKPKQYRPFANAEEFKPHRDRWWRYKDERMPNQQLRTCSFDDFHHDGKTWKDSFAYKVFDDGTPFGVEVTE